MTKQSLLAMSCAAVLLSACGGGGGGGAPDVTPVTEAVPAEASTDSGAAITYVSALVAVPESTSDMLEPVTPVPDMLATDDTGEPVVIPE